MPRHPNGYEATDLGPFSIDPALPVAQQLAVALRDKILGGMVAPGAVISETMLAEACGVSKTPARQAVKELIGENLLVSLSSRGTFVPLLDLKRLKDSLFVRRQIEPRIAALAAEHSERQRLIDALVRLLQSQEAAIHGGNGAEVYRVDASFHSTICDFIGSPLLWQVVRGVRSESDRAHALWRSPESLVAALDQHRAITEAIELGDSAGSAEAMDRHLRGNEILLEEIGRRYPQYFH